MSHVNQFRGIGFLGANPEQSTTPGGAAVTKFRLGMSNDYFDKNTQQWVKQESTWAQVTCWRDLAQKVMTTLSKGDKVQVIGKIITSSYPHKTATVQDKDGNTVPYMVQKTEIQAEYVDRLHHVKQEGGYQPRDTDFRGNPDAAYQGPYDDFDVGDLGPPLDMDDNPLSPGD